VAPAAPPDRWAPRCDYLYINLWYTFFRKASCGPSCATCRTRATVTVLFQDAPKPSVPQVAACVPRLQDSQLRAELRDLVGEPRDVRLGFRDVFFSSNIATCVLRFAEGELRPQLRDLVGEPRDLGF